MSKRLSVRFSVLVAECPRLDWLSVFQSPMSLSLLSLGWALRALGIIPNFSMSINKIYGLSP